MRKCNRKSYLYRLAVYREYLANEKLEHLHKPSNHPNFGFRNEKSQNKLFVELTIIILFLFNAKQATLKPKLTEQTTKFQLDCVL